MGARVRERKSPVRQLCSSTYSEVGHSPVYRNLGYLDYLGDHEVISDFTSPVKRGGYRLAQPCCHSHTRTSFSEDSCGYSRPGVWTIEFPNPHSFLTYASPDLRQYGSNINFLPSYNLNNLLYDAYNGMRPTLVDPRLDMTVSLLELRDIRRQFEVFSKRYWKARKTWEALNDQHLSYQFGWKPLVSDLRQLFELYLNFEERVNKLLREQNTIQVRHYKKSIPFPGVTQSSTISEVRGTFTAEGSCEFNAGMGYQYYLPGYGGQKDQILFLLDALGMCKGWQSLWELVPWSFVVDWFVDVGSWLGQFSGEATDVALELLWFHYSIVTNYRTRCTVESLYDSRYTNTGCLTYYTASQRTYVRGITLPPLDRELELGSGFRWVLGSSLLASLLGTRRR